MDREFKLRIYNIDGTEEDKVYTEHPKLEELQKLVGGYIELVNIRLGGGIKQLLVNEDGLQKKLKYNKKASALYHGMIVGDAVLLLNFTLK